MRNNRKAGFSLVELVIVIVIIGVIAAIAIPRVTQATKGAGETALSSNLSVLRSAIELYATEHGGTYPAKEGAGAQGAAGSEAAFKAQLTMYTNSKGEVATSRSKDYPLGPYLAKDVPPMPVGENKGKNKVEVKTVTTALTTEVAGGAGWIYSCETGEIIANSDLRNEADTKDYKAF